MDEKRRSPAMTAAEAVRRCLLTSGRTVVFSATIVFFRCGLKVSDTLTP
jgi:hypothetical protein